MAGGSVTLEPGDNDLKRALVPVHQIALGIGRGLSVDRP